MEILDFNDHDMSGWPIEKPNLAYSWDESGLAEEQPFTFHHTQAVGELLSALCDHLAEPEDQITFTILSASRDGMVPAGIQTSCGRGVPEEGARIRMLGRIACDLLRPARFFSKVDMPGNDHLNAQIYSTLITTPPLSAHERLEARQRLREAAYDLRRTDAQIDRALARGRAFINKPELRPQ